MQFVFFYHSLISDWNHGNAHFLRGVVAELQRRGHNVRVFEPADGWSLRNLREEYGAAAIEEFNRRFPALKSRFYSLANFDLDEALDGANIVLAHEWNDLELVRRLGQHRLKSHYRLLFHDTHHRAVTDRESIAKYPLDSFDGVLAFGEVIRDLYVRNGWARQAWTWHEAADTTVFRPVPCDAYDGDIAWIGNWGDEERSLELSDYFIDPVRELRLQANVYGVRYPEYAKARLTAAGIRYGGWIPNYQVPHVLGRHRATVHIPRRPYAETLPGIPTIRVFEALACGVPLVCTKWDDAEQLFTPREDYLVARTPDEMKKHLQAVVGDKSLARQLAEHGLKTILARHTCAHRVDELLEICPSPSPAACPDAAGEGKPAFIRPFGPPAFGGRRPSSKPHIAFFGSSLTSAYWNGAATYYRGIIRALYERGFRITFYEPDAYDRQKHRDIEDPAWARVVVYSAADQSNLDPLLEEAKNADIVVKTSGIGVFDTYLEAAIAVLARPQTSTIFWDVDAPATLDRIGQNPADPFRSLIPKYDMILTYGGGDPVVRGYLRHGARLCVPIYNALDPDTHYPAAPDSRFEADLGFLANRLPDREARVRDFFFGAAEALPGCSFVFGGNGWQGAGMPPNIKYVGHVFTADHNAFNSSPRAILNVNRDSMARYGFSPATRVFEAAGAGACLITDAWEGLDLFLEPGREVLAAKNGHDVADLLNSLDANRARRIGEAARRRVLDEHTYAKRAEQFESILEGSTVGAK
jgi:spore maturation protein CgeB